MSHANGALLEQPRESTSDRDVDGWIVVESAITQRSAIRVLRRPIDIVLEDDIESRESVVLRPFDGQIL